MERRRLRTMRGGRAVARTVAEDEPRRRTRRGWRRRPTAAADMRRERGGGALETLGCGTESEESSGDDTAVPVRFFCKQWHLRVNSSKLRGDFHILSVALEKIGPQSGFRVLGIAGRNRLIDFYQRCSGICLFGPIIRLYWMEVAYNPYQTGP